MRAKLYKSQSRRKDPSMKTKPTKYGQLLLGDHFILSETEAGFDGERASLNTLDVGTMWTDVGPAKSKSAMDSELTLREHVGDNVVTRFFSDGSPELKKAAAELQWVHETSTPHRPQTNGLMEITNRSLKEGTAAVLYASGFNHAWWPLALKYIAFAFNLFSKKVLDGKTPFEARHGKPFPGKFAAFGRLIYFKVHGPEAKKLQKFVSGKAIPGLFLGWDTQPGGLFHGDYCVAAIKDFDAAHSTKRVPIHRVKEIIVDGEEQFPMREGVDKYELEVKTLHAPDTTMPGDILTEEDAEDEIVAAIPKTQEAKPPAQNIQRGGSSSSTAPPVAADGAEVIHEVIPITEEVIPIAGEQDNVVGKRNKDGVLVDLDSSGVQQRPYKNTQRVPGVWKETWAMMDPSAKRAAHKKYQEDMKNAAVSYAAVAADLPRLFRRTEPS
jgi:hypothetical protein